MKTKFPALLFIAGLIYYVGSYVLPLLGKDSAEKQVEVVLNCLNGADCKAADLYLDTTSISRDEFNIFSNKIFALKKTGFEHLGLFERLLGSVGKFVTISEFGCPNHFRDEESFEGLKKRDVSVFLKDRGRENIVYELLITFKGIKSDAKICGVGFYSKSSQ